MEQDYQELIQRHPHYNWRNGEKYGEFDVYDEVGGEVKFAHEWTLRIYEVADSRKKSIDFKRMMNILNKFRDKVTVEDDGFCKYLGLDPSRWNPSKPLVWKDDSGKEHALFDLHGMTIKIENDKFIDGFGNAISEDDFVKIVEIGRDPVIEVGVGKWFMYAKGLYFLGKYVDKDGQHVIRENHTANGREYHYRTANGEPVEDAEFMKLLENKWENLDCGRAYSEYEEIQRTRKRLYMEIGCGVPATKSRIPVSPYPMLS
jgi:hypothetical protein